MFKTWNYIASILPDMQNSLNNTNCVLCFLYGLTRGFYRFGYGYDLIYIYIYINIYNIDL